MHIQRASVTTVGTMRVPTDPVYRAEWMRNGSLLALIVTIVFATEHAVLGGGLPLWCYVLSAVSFAWAATSMEFLRRSLARKRRQAE